MKIRYMTLLLATLVSTAAFANDRVIVTRSDLYRGTKINCTAETSTFVERPNDLGYDAESDDSKSKVLTDGNQQVVTGEVVLAPTRATRRRFDVEVDGTYLGNGTNDKTLSIQLSTVIGRHEITDYGNTEATLNIDDTSYTCQIVSVAQPTKGATK